jgi:hypothetical protein
MKCSHCELKRKECEFYSISHVFGHKIEDIFGFRGWILMKDSVLETLLVVDFILKKFHHKILRISLQNLASKLKFAENRQGS